ncbi:zf-HC2 domain-containing protein [Streptomyces purpureus]|uniref:Integral membrane protein n=1 Tax=Streptomyces purpureus TaxID=1951 RepID=A0A918H8P1_9ACTN|nr:zf-HC2 domain-containing protein [Streptomyces purpureus]GGT46425.1 hypothetical protein GCM10014713_45540 [Streptomyces purpureus]
MTDAQAASYATGSAPETDAWSLEKHVESCGDCAARVSAAVRATTAGPELAAIRASILTAATTPRAVTGRLGELDARGGLRLSARGGVPHFAARASRLLWAAGPAVRGAWMVAVVLVGAAAVALAYGAGYGAARQALLAVAPVLPLAGVAVSYGRHADPMYEIGASTPSGGLRLLLTRTAAVLAVSVPLLTAAGAVLPGGSGGPGAAAWLLPGLALTLATLALGSFVGCRAAAGTLSTAWLLAVAGPVVGRPGTGSLPLAADLVRLLSGAAAQGAWAAGAVVCAGLLVLRRRSFDLMEPR